MSYIKVENLNYSYPDEKNKSICDINLEIDNGEILLLCGKSGSGKSTLGRCFTGAVPNFYGGTIGGNIIINGKRLNELSERERASYVTMVFQDPEKQILMDRVFREISFGPENVGVESKVIKRRVIETMQFCNILHLRDRLINTLSGGEKQKVAVASALAYMPKIIVFDEPTSQLDPEASDEIVNLIKKINSELGITVVLIEQRIDRCFDAADKIAVMKDGRIVFYGDKVKMYSDNLNEVKSFLPSYLKACKILGRKKMPQSFKSLRKSLSKSEVSITNLDEQKINSVREDCAIEMRKVTCKYGDIAANNNIDLNIKSGSFNAIIGSNGAGKSTLVKAIMGFVNYNGNIKILGHEVKKLKFKDIGIKIGYVSQNPNDYLSKDTVYDELKFTLNNYRINDDNLIDHTLKELDIYKLKSKNPRDLSGGEKQRAAIASVLVLKPEILILDEPTRGLDEEGKYKLGSILKTLNNNGSTIIMITHDLDFAARFCSNFILMFDGKVISSGSKYDVLKDGIYYTTNINKLFRDVEPNVFVIEDIKGDAL